MLQNTRVYPTGSGGPFAVAEKRPNLPSPNIRKGRECFAYRNAIPLLFKSEERFRGLTPNETTVLASLLRRARAEYGGRCWPTHEQLANDLHGGISVRNLTRVVASLREKGWIAIESAHANQRLPSGAQVRGERNVYAIDLARITGATADTSRRDGQDVHPRDANADAGAVENVEEHAASNADAVDLNFNKHTDPQRDAAHDECVETIVDLITDEEPEVPTGRASAETIACMVLAFWMQTVFPEFAEREGHIDIAAGPDGHARVARVLGLFQRGFDAETLKDAILGASHDTFVREAGCPLGLVFGDKLLHYARRGAEHRAKRRRAEARVDAARTRAATPCERPRSPQPELPSQDQVLANISRILSGANGVAPTRRRALGT